MLQLNKIRTPRKQNGIFIYSTSLFLSIAVYIVHILDSQQKLRVLTHISNILLFIILTIIISQITLWFIRNKAHKGIKYAVLHYLILFNLRKFFIDSSYFNKRLYFNSEVAQLPKIKLEFSKDFSRGQLAIENINLKKDLKNINISFAIKQFVIDRSYLSKDELYYIFEIYDSNIIQQYNFKNLKEFVSISAQVSDYTLIVDKSVSIPLYGTLLVGQTGSGKTYALYSLILQMMMKKIQYNIYFADPKNSSLAVIGEKISKERTATNIDDIILLLNTFNLNMEERKAAIKKDLHSRLEATYEDFRYEPFIFIFDEFASFQTVLQTLEKKKRDEVMKLLSQIVLQGRQLGFFLWIVMQKSDATLLPTNLRENLPIKFVLGNAESQTYITAFGTGLDLPVKNYKLGQGLFTCPLIAATPKVCHFSYLNFDILESVNHLKSRAGVM